MKVRWTTPALQHLHDAYDYIHLDKPSAAAQVADRILAASERLRLFPQMGRVSKRPGTRELAIAGTPFILVYRVRNGTLEVLALYHGAQNWQQPE